MGGKSQSPNTPNIVHFLRQHVIKRSIHLCNFLWVSLVDTVHSNGTTVTHIRLDEEGVLYSNQFF